LPQELVQAKTVKSFEILLDKYWENQEVKYDYNEEIMVKTGKCNSVVSMMVPVLLLVSAHFLSIQCPS
jgi:hypothetical protein